MGQLSKKVGKRIKEIRESLNIKQYELAEKLEMEPSNLTRIESGYQKPKEENLTKIADILGVKEMDLFDFGDVNSKTELISKIDEILQQSSEAEINYFYKLLLGFKRLY